MGGLALFAMAVSATSLIIMVIRPVAFRVGLVDEPGHRKLHAGNAPLVGGIAIYISICILVFFLNIEFSDFALFAALGGILVVFSAADDLMDIPPIFRLLMHLYVAAAMAMTGGIVLSDLGYLLGSAEPFYLHYLGLPLTVLVAAGLMNAINMSDGVDGLAGSLCLVAVGAVLVPAALLGAVAEVRFLLVAFGAIAGFLLFNMRLGRKRHDAVFLGDAGSMFLGFLLAWVLIRNSQGAGAIVTPVVALWITAVPIFDGACSIIRRMLQGKTPFEADRNHIHHLLMRAGFSASETVGIISGLAAFFAATGLVSMYLGVPDMVMLVLLVATFMIYTWVVMRASKSRSLLGISLAPEVNARVDAEPE